MSGDVSDPDLELVKALAGGADSALDELMSRYEEPIFHFIYRHVFSEADARELAQEVFVRAYFNIGKFKPQAKFATWLYQIALNLCRDHTKSRRAHQALLTDSLSAWEDAEEHQSHDLAVERRTPADEAITHEKLTVLEAGMAALPHDLRTALVLTSLEERSHQDCAELLKITPKAVETRVYRARKFLLEWLGKAGFALLLAGVVL
jgi:RNA polymerase sigma factor (sigma-70 family)